MGDEFNLISISEISIDNKRLLSPVKEYNFKEKGIHLITFTINGTLNMDNMFKDVSTLISVKMLSRKNDKIISMISSFENCYNLSSFNIKGFDTKELKSMSKLFSNSSLKLQKTIFKDINIENVEDMSYMFYNCTFLEFNISNFRPKNAKNISHMFEGCKSLVKLNVLILFQILEKALKFWEMNLI